MGLHHAKLFEENTDTKLICERIRDEYFGVLGSHIYSSTIKCADVWEKAAKLGEWNTSFVVEYANFLLYKTVECKNELSTYVLILLV